MHVPRVSICLPNLNYRRYLPERLETIHAQSFADWELVAVDGHSDDGSWELLTEHAAREPRMRITQAPREGVYAAINACVRLARGEFVYIATSDDTMAVDCIAKLVAALDAYPECDLAHCPLRVEGVGAGEDEAERWWKEASLFARSSRALVDRLHIRRAPLDGLLHLYGETVYISLTQLLIRRTLFERVGAFDGRWGSVGDFNWDMRASLVANTVHVPDTWAGWRVHPEQATPQAVARRSAQHRSRMDEMIEDALRRAWNDLPATVREGLEGGWRHAFGEDWALQQELRRRGNRAARAGYLLSRAAVSAAARSYIARRLRRMKTRLDSPGEIVDSWLRSRGVTACLTPGR